MVVVVVFVTLRSILGGSARTPMEARLHGRALSMPNTRESLQRAPVFMKTPPVDMHSSAHAPRLAARGQSSQAQMR